MIALFAWTHLSVLTVGDGQQFSTITEAVGAARDGDTVEVHSKAAGYAGEFVRITQPNLTIRAVGPILVDGTGTNYSGAGSVPRAIFEFEPTGVGSSVIGFEFNGAHNETHNGAGVRINACENAHILNCNIHGNDMGIMSNAASGQEIKGCLIHENGDPTDPGQNHNLYLGGISGSVSGCQIYGALTGHNLKSRLHYLVVRDCTIYGGDNRQLDLVDAPETALANSNAVLIHNRISMNPNAAGNHNLMHFGQESGTRNGTLYCFGNRFETPFSSALLLMDSSTCSSVWVDNTVVHAGGGATFLSPADATSRISGYANRIPSTYSLPPGVVAGSNRKVVFQWIDGDGNPREAPSIDRF